MNKHPNVNMLFYSNKCQTCKALCVLLQNENLIGYFKPICVDDKLDKFPQDMIVPTMIIIGINKPLVAQETFEWIKQIKFIRQQQLMDINKKNIQTNMNNINVNNIRKGPMGY